MSGGTKRRFTFYLSESFGPFHGRPLFEPSQMGLAMTNDRYDEQPAKLTPTQARAGFISGRVVTVLVASFILAVILVGGATVFWTTTH